MLPLHLDQIRTQYLATLLARHATLHLPLHAGEHTLPLQTIFQPLTLRHGPLSFDDLEQAQNGTQVITALNGTEALALSRSRRMVVLGGPGMGKTTLLKALLHQAIIQAQSELMAPLPLFLSLPDLARSGLTLQAYLPGILAELGIEAGYGDTLVEAVSEGRAFVCLDSLDEVVPAQRPDMIALINREAMRCGGTWIIGSRFTEYKGGQFVHSQFAEWELQALDEPMRVKLARHLLPALAELLQITPVPVAEDFVKTLSEETRIAAWGENPLLFSLTVIVYVQAGSLPSSRASLYRDIVEIMLGARFPEGSERGELRRLLAEVALELYQTKGRNFTVADLLALLARLYPELSFQKQTEMVGRILDAGLLDRVAYETYGFKHQMFQEYLCAVALAHRLVSQEEPEQRAAWEFLWRKHLYSRWSEVLRLCVGVLVQEHGEAGSLVAGRWLLRLVDEQKTPEGDVGDLCLELALGSVREYSSALYTDEMTEVVRTLIMSWVEILMQPRTRTDYLDRGRMGRLAEDVKMLDLHLVLPAMIWLESVRDHGYQRLDSYDAAEYAGKIFELLNVEVAATVLIAAYPDSQGISLSTYLHPETLRVYASREKLMRLCQDMEAHWRVREGAVYLLGLWEDQTLISLFCSVLEDSSNYYQIRIAVVEALAKLRERMPVERLVALLQDKNEQIRIAIVTALVYAGEHVSIEPFFMALDDTREVCTAAQKAIKNLRKQIAPEPLLVALDSENDTIRIAAIELLGSRMPMDLLLIALHDPNEQVRSVAVRVAERMGERAPLAAVLEALQDQDVVVRRDAVTTLGRLGETVPIDAIVEYLQAKEKGPNDFHLDPLEPLCRSISVEVLIKLAQDQKMLRRALDIALTLHLSLPVDLLLAALDHPSNPYDDDAPRLLVRMGSDVPMTILLEMLFNPSAKGRLGAAKTLYLLGRRIPTEPLITLLKVLDVDSDLYGYVVLLLLQNEVSVPVDALMHVLKMENLHDIKAENMIVTILEDLCERAPIEELLALLPDDASSWQVDDRVVQVLGSVSEWVISERLMVAASHRVEDEKLAVNVLGVMGKDAPVALLKSVLDDKTRDQFLRVEARHALYKVGVNLPWRCFLSESDLGFRGTDTATVETMRRLGPQAPIEELLEFLVSNNAWIDRPSLLEGSSNNDDWVRDTVIESLRELNLYLPFERLVGMLDHENPLAREDAAFILGVFGERAPIDKLIALAYDQQEVSSVRVVALGALAELHAYVPPEVLTTMLYDKKKNVRRSALLSLQEWGRDIPLEPLLALIADDECDLRDDAIEVLGSMQDRAPVALLVSLLDSDCVYEVARFLCRLGKYAPLDVLIAHLYGNDGDIDTDVLNVFFELGEYAPFELIFQLLEHEDPLVRDCSESCLTHLAEVAPAKFVAFAKDDLRPVVRKALMEAIALLGKDAPIDQIDLALSALEDEDADVRFKARVAVFDLNVDPARLPLEPLLRALYEGDGKPNSHWSELELLAKLGAQVPVAPLLTLLGDINTDACENAAETLYQTHPDVFAEVAQQAEAILRGEPTGEVFASRVQSRVADQVRHIGRANPEVLMMLTEMLNWPYWEVQMKAAQALGAVSRNIPDQAIRRLMELRHDPGSEAVREAADAALAEILSRESGLEDE